MAEKTIFEKIISTAKNHLERVHEGQQLLAEGRPLSEMKTEPTGLSQEEFRQTREEYLSNVRAMDQEKLNFIYGNVRYQLERRWDHPDKGTSELEWRRLILESVFEEKGFQIPDINFEKIKKG